MSSIEKALDLLNKSKLREGTQILFELQKHPTTSSNAFLVWAIILHNCPYRFLALEATRREMQISGSKEAKTFALNLMKESSDSRMNCPKDLPKISIIGLLS